MDIRWLISNWVRQTAQQKIYEAAQQARQGGTAGAAPQSAEAPPTEPAEPVLCDIAAVFALGIEAGGFVDLLSDQVTTKAAHFTEHLGRIKQHTLAVIESGAGREAAARATADVIAVRQPQWVISAGFAGGLDPQLRRGHILMADVVSDLRGKQLEVGLKMDPAALAAMKSLHVGRLLTVDALASKAEEKQALGVQHQALACDLETIGVAETCQERKVRFLSVRIISDAVEDELPAYLEQMIEQKSTAGRLGAAAAALWQRPSHAKEMWKLREDALLASDRLAKFLAGVLPQLTLDPPRQLPEKG